MLIFVNLSPNVQSDAGMLADARADAHGAGLTQTDDDVRVSVKYSTLRGNVADYNEIDAVAAVLGPRCTSIDLGSLMGRLY